MTQEEKWVSMKEICEHLGISRDTVKKMIRTKNMPAVSTAQKPYEWELELLQ